MSDFLTSMTEASLERARQTRESADELHRMAFSLSAPPRLDLSGPGFDVIAEPKLASPSEGRLVAEGDGRASAVELASIFASNGAAALSVLTESTRFDGDLAHLEEVARSTRLPVMRKDFLVDPVQVYESRVAGAAGVLLIARILPGDLLVRMTDLALELGMFVLVEVFDIADLQNAVGVFDREVLVGVNSRDLATLGVDSSRFATLAPHLPDHLPAVAESGIVDLVEVAAVARLGYRAALMGSALVGAADPGARLLGAIEAGRAALLRAGR